MTKEIKLGEDKMNYWNSENWQGLNREEFEAKVPKSARLTLKECRKICKFLYLVHHDFPNDDPASLIEWLKDRPNIQSINSDHTVEQMANFVQGGILEPSVVWSKTWFGNFVGTVNFMMCVSDQAQLDANLFEKIFPTQNFMKGVEDYKDSQKDEESFADLLFKAAFLSQWLWMTKGGIVRKETLKAMPYWANHECQTNNDFFEALFYIAEDIVNGAYFHLLQPWSIKDEEAYADLCQTIVENTIARSVYLYLDKSYGIQLVDLLKIGQGGVLSATAARRAIQTFVINYSSKESDDDADYCIDCGGDLDSDDELNCKECRGLVDEEDHDDEDYCLDCGEGLDSDDEDFCEECRGLVDKEKFTQLLDRYLLVVKKAVEAKTDLEGQFDYAFNNTDLGIIIQEMFSNNCLEDFYQQHFTLEEDETDWTNKQVYFAEQLRNYILQTYAFTLNLHSCPLGLQEESSIPFMVVLSAQNLKKFSPERSYIESEQLPVTASDKRFFGDQANKSLKVVWDENLYDLKQFSMMTLDEIMISQFDVLTDGDDFNASSFASDVPQLQFCQEQIHEGLFVLCGLIVGNIDEMQKFAYEAKPKGLRTLNPEKQIHLLDMAGKNPTSEMIETLVNTMASEEFQCKTAEAKVFGVFPFIPFWNRKFIESLALTASMIGYALTLVNQLHSEDDSLWIDLSDPRPTKELISPSIQYELENTPMESMFTVMAEDQEHDFFMVEGGVSELSYLIPMGIPINKELRSPQIVKRTEEMLRNVLKGHNIEVRGRLKPHL